MARGIRPPLLRALERNVIPHALWLHFLRACGEQRWGRCLKKPGRREKGRGLTRVIATEYGRYHGQVSPESGGSRTGHALSQTRFVS